MKFRQDWAARSARRRAALFAPLPRRLTVTVDLEDHGTGAERLDSVTRRLLDALDAAGARATVFVLGETAAAVPALVREAARRGHEIASHGERHRPLERETPAGLRAGLAACRARLEDLAGAPVTGFRAPFFSLTRRSAWAAAVLAEAGFAYSSSVLPAWSPMHGFPGAPRHPFLWPGGLLEIPCPVARVGPFAMPFLGGMYLRYLPPWRLRACARQVAAEGHPALWTYLHPYDLDTEAGVGRIRGFGLGASLFLSMNRRVTAPRLAALVQGRESLPLAERAAEWRARATRFAP